MDVPAGGGDAGGYEHLRSLFEKWDSNGNGVLEYPEIRDLLKELKGSDVSHDEVMEFYRCTDKNSDAKVDFMEFTTAYTQFTNLGPRGSKKRTIGSPEAKRQRDDVRTLEMQQFNLNYTPQQLLDEILAGHAEDELDLRMVMLGMDVTPKASKYAYLKGKTDLFGPYFEQLAPKLTPLLNGADSGGVLNCLHQVAQLLQITEVFSTEIERLKHKGYIHEVFTFVQDTFPVVNMALNELRKLEEMPRADDDVGQNLRGMMLQVLRRFLQEDRLPVWDKETEDVLRVKCKEYLAKYELYDILPALLAKYVTQISAIMADEPDPLTPQSKEFHILAELVLCIGAAAENMAFCLPPDGNGHCAPADAAKGALLKLFVLHPNILQVLNFPNIPLALVKAVLSTLSILMGFSQNYEAATGGFLGPFAMDEAMAVGYTRLLTATLGFFVKVAETPDASGNPFSAFPSDFICIGTNIFLILTQLVQNFRLAPHFDAVDESFLSRVFNTLHEGCDYTIMAYATKIVGYGWNADGSAVEADRTAVASPWLPQHDHQGKRILIRQCLLFLEALAVSSYSIDGKLTLARREVCKGLASVPDLKHAFHGYFNSGPDYTSLMSPDDEYGSVAGKALQILRAYSFADPLLATGVLNEYGSELVRLLASPAVRDSALSVLSECAMQAGSMPGILDPAMNCNLLDQLCQSMLAYKRHHELLESVWSGTEFSPDWDYLKKAVSLLEHLFHDNRYADRCHQHHLDSFRSLRVLFQAEIRMGHIHNCTYNSTELADALAGMRRCLNALQSSTSPSCPGFIKKTAHDLWQECGPEAMDSAYLEAEEEAEAIVFGDDSMMVGPAAGFDRENYVDATFVLGAGNTVGSKGVCSIRKPPRLERIKKTLEDKYQFKIKNLEVTLLDKSKRVIVTENQRSDGRDAWTVQDFFTYWAETAGAVGMPTFRIYPENEFIAGMVMQRMGGGPIAAFERDAGKAIVDMSDLLMKYQLKVDKGLIAKVHAAFKDVCGDKDAIGPEQFCRMFDTPSLKSAHFAASAEQLEMLFKAFDTSQDGLLELPEIIVGMVRLTADDKDVKEETKLGMIFDAYDDDHSGTLEAEELVKLMTVATGKSAEAIRVFAISILEVSYKEDNGHLSRKNFIDACKSGLLNMSAVLKRTDDLKGLFGDKRQRTDGSGAPKKSLCRNFAAGNCRFADCQFSHDVGGQGRVGGRVGGRGAGGGRPGVPRQQQQGGQQWQQGGFQQGGGARGGGGGGGRGRSGQGQGGQQF